MDLDPGPDEYVITTPGTYENAFIIKFGNNQPTPVRDIIYPSLDAIIRTYPNPSRGQVRLDIRDTYPEVELNLLNTAGQLIDKRSYYSQSTLSHPFDVPPGSYYFELVVPGIGRQVVPVIRH